MPALMQRQYIDLIRTISSKWVNWDPPIEIRVGSYGTIDKETGDLIVEGNIYDPEFQREMDNQGIQFCMANHQPQEGSVEDDFIIASRGAKRKDLNADSELDFPGIANASIKAQWLFERGKRNAVLIMHSPRQVYIPPNVVLEHLYKVDKLIDKSLVTAIHVCPAYSMYLSDKSGEKFSVALAAQAPVAGAVGVTASAHGGLEWVIDAQSGLIRKACDQTGNNPFTPLYSLRRPIKRNRRFFRDAIKPEPTGDNLWYNDSPPWDPLDEDGVEDPFDPSIKLVDPFKLVDEAAAAAKAAAIAAASASASATT